MSTRPLLDPFPIITNGDMSGNITGLVTIINQPSMLSYGLSWAGTSPVGTVSVQGSNDYKANPAGGVSNAGTWNTLTLNYNGTFVTTIPVSGNTGNGLIDIGPTGIYAIRLIYTFGSGVGTLQATINAKAA